MPLEVPILIICIILLVISTVKLHKKSIELGDHKNHYDKTSKRFHLLLENVPNIAVQGYLYTKALPAKEFETFLEKSQAST